MKALLFPACLAATAAFAAELKNPAEVVRDWEDTLAETTQPLAGDLSLQGTVTSTRLARPQIEFKKLFAPSPDRAPGSRSPGMDAPLPNSRPENMAPNAKPYHFEGRTYWLVPLTAKADS